MGIAVVCLTLGYLAFRMHAVYRAAQLEFHPLPVQLGAPPAGLAAVEFPSRDGSLLRGWFSAGTRGAAVVLLHGSEADRRQLLPEAQALSAAGFGVLLFDWPGEGESEGKITWSRTEPEALLGALDWLGKAAPRQRLGALGFSMGAGILAVVAARDPRLEALVLEAPILDMDDEVAREYGHWGLLTRLPAWLGKRAGGYDPSAPKPLEVMAAMTPRPLLVIAGAADPVAPPEDARRLLAAAPGAGSLWIVPGARHGGYRQAAGPEYEARLVQFFAESLPAAR